MKSLRSVTYGVLSLALLLGGCRSKKQPAPVAPAKEVSAEKEEIYEIIPRWEPPLGDSIRHEMRAVWVTTAYGLDWPKVKADTPEGIRRQKQEFDRMLDNLVEDGYNTVFLQVRQSGSVIYPSKTEPYTRVFTRSGRRPDYDPLRYAVEACQRRGLAIHGWLVTYPIVSPKSSPHPMLVMHPQWAVKHNGGRHLDPGLPEVRSYIARVARELASNYDLDGLHFDYFRYPEQAERFPDHNSYLRYGGGRDKDEWRRDNLTKQLAEIRDEVASVKPYLQISVAPLGKLRKLETLELKHGWTAYESVHQDPITWAKRGLIDFLVPMMYYRDQLYTPFLKDWTKLVGRYVPVVAGLAPYRMVEDKWSAETIIGQMQEERELGSGGVCFFRQEHVGAGAPSLRRQIKQFFSRTALPLALPRGLELRPQYPRDLALKRREDGSYAFTWGHYRTDYDTPITYRVWAVAEGDDRREQAILLASRLQSKELTIDANFLARYNRIELGVEVVNSYGVSRSSIAPFIVTRDLLKDLVMQ